MKIRGGTTSHLQSSVDEDNGMKTLEATQTKMFASRSLCRLLPRIPFQIHGGYGCTKDYPVEKLWRDSKLLTIGLCKRSAAHVIARRNVLAVETDKSPKNVNRKRLHLQKFFSLIWVEQFYQSRYYFNLGLRGKIHKKYISIEAGLCLMELKFLHPENAQLLFLHNYPNTNPLADIG